MIDLRRLHVLRAVAHHGTVTSAAHALHFTPSAASQQIRQLGHELGVALLEPHGRRVRLTTAAERLLEHADAIEARWEKAEVDLRGHADEPTGLLRLGGFPVAVSTLLAPLAATLRELHPRLLVRIQEGEDKETFDQLFNGECDLAIVEATPANPPLADARFDQQPLLDDIFDLVVPDTHQMAGRPDVPLAEAATEEWVIPSADSTCRAHTVAACSAAGFTPNDVHHAMDWSAIAGIVANRLGVALVPRLAYLPPHLPVARVPLRGNPRPVRKLLTCTRAGSSEHPAVAAALAELRRSTRDRVAQLMSE